MESINEPYREESPVQDNHSNNEHDFEHVSHSDAAYHQAEEFDDLKSGSTIERQPPSRAYNDDVNESEEERDSPSVETSYTHEGQGDMPADEPPSYTEEQDIKTASETSEMLKRHIPPQIREIIYWHSPLTSVALLSALLLFEFSLLFFSVISVLAYTGLTIMVASLALKLYVHFVSTSGDSVIHRYMEADWSISHERTEQVSRDILNKLNRYVLYTRDLFLINNYGESIKFAIFLYILTYIGAWFNFLTLVILGTVFTFSIPKVYDLYKREIDHIFNLARRQLKEKWIPKKKCRRCP